MTTGLNAFVVTTTVTRNDIPIERLVALQLDSSLLTHLVTSSIGVCYSFGGA